MLIGDNQDREDLILIDRQVTDRAMHGKRIDLLALQQVEANVYRFLVIEVKMGKNPELQEQVADQLQGYIDHLTQHWPAYQRCYETQYAQKRAFGLLRNPPWERIRIVPGVNGLVVVGGYSGLAERQIAALSARFPEVRVQQIISEIKLP